MTPRRSLLLVPALACGLAAQAPPSVALPPELDRVLRDYERAWTAKDPAALARLFTAEGMALPSGQPPAQGAASIRQAYAQHAGSPLALRALAYATSGDLAYIIGGFAPAPGQPDLGKFVLVLRRGAGGRWLIAADMDNANQRRPALPPPSRQD